MNRSELERQLRDDAQALDLRCPDTARQRVLRQLDGWTAGGRRRRQWLPLSAAAAAALAVAIAGVLWLAPGPGNDPAPSMRLAATPPVSSAVIDRAVAGRESDLAAEARRIRSDIERIRRLVTDA